MTTSDSNPSINTTDLSVVSKAAAAMPANGNLADIGAVANAVGAQHIFQKYLRGKSENTLTRHAYDLRLFTDYLRAVGVRLNNRDFQYDPNAWAGITWGLVEGFLAWQLREGFAVTSANARLSTVRVYCRLATKAGVIPQEDGMLIGTVVGYSRHEAINLDEQREVSRIGWKKETAVTISSEQATALKTGQENTPAGLRNRLILCLLLDHGLRASEVVAIEQAGFDFAAQTLTFWRKKTKGWTTHKLTPETNAAAVAYRPWMAAEGGIFWSSRKDGQLMTTKLTRITVSRLVQRLGVDVGFYREEATVTPGGRRKVQRIGTLSAHDCRHYCATEMAQRGYPLKKLVDWFGWTSPAMAMRYVAGAEVQTRDLG